MSRKMEKAGIQEGMERINQPTKRQVSKRDGGRAGASDRRKEWPVSSRHGKVALHSTPTSFDLRTPKPS